MTDRSELGGALRAWRERLAPERAGLPPGGDRRVPGLRREELALLSGISVDYLARLEQGRATNPSTQVLAALTRALQLGHEERELLYRRAGSVPPPSGEVPRRVPPGVQLMIDRMPDTPVAVYTAAWETIQWNALWGALLGDPGALDARARNLIWRHFGTPQRGNGPHAGYVEHDAAHADAFEREMVDDLRRAAERYPDDRAVAELVDALREASPRFAELWTRYEAVPHSPARKTIVHPEIGAVAFDCDVLIIEGSDLRIVIYSAEPGSPEAEALDRLRSGSAQLAAGRDRMPHPDVTRPD